MRVWAQNFFKCLTHEGLTQNKKMGQRNMANM